MLWKLWVEVGRVHLGADGRGVEVVSGELGREMEPVRGVMVSDRNRAEIIR